MRIVQLNLAADFTVSNAEDLLDRYHTLTGWARALTAAGADVHVIQRFSSPAALSHDDVPYRFVADGGPALLSPWSVSNESLEAVAQVSPAVVHVNGLMFPAMTAALRVILGPRVSIVLQDHAGVVPRLPWLRRTRTQQRWAEAFAAADACTFTARELAGVWRQLGMPAEMNILELAEASTAFTPLVQEDARRRTGMTDAPTLLWVGRANANKDPATLLEAFQMTRRERPDAQLWMIVASDRDRRVLDALRARYPVASDNLHIIGPVPHSNMPLYYSAADILVSSSHREGSGYAVIEAMACGLFPCVSDIPSFRALTGAIGVRWEAGHAAECAAAIRRAMVLASAARRQVTRKHFDDHLSWPVLGRRTFAAYAALNR